MTVGNGSVRKFLVLASGFAWGALLLEHEAPTTVMLCSLPALSPTVLLVNLSVNGPVPMIGAFGLMLAAMMLPLLAEPVRDVYIESFARRRVRGVTLFLCAYAALWMAAAVPLMLMATIIRLAPVLVVPAVFVTMLWECSPAKQRCLNRCHVSPSVAGFGWNADLAAVRFGCVHATWCIGACWLLMLLSMAISVGHLAVMLGVGLWIFCQRLERPQAPAWKLRAPWKFVRLIRATHLRRQTV